MLVGTLFGRATLKYTAAIVVLLTLYFIYIRWLGYEWIMISVVMVLGLLVYIRYAQQESDL
jgi:H+/gluconate symporter-like permease